MLVRLARVKKPAKMVEDVQSQPTEKVWHFLSRVAPLCEGNTKSKREKKCKYMTSVVIYIYYCRIYIQPCHKYIEIVAGKRVECNKSRKEGKFKFFI